MPRSAASRSATARSWGVVVGDRNSSVSDRMQVSAVAFAQSGILAASSPIRSTMIVAVQARGRTVMSIGPLVSSPPTSLWWSMIARMSALLMPAGSSAGLLVSTITTGASSATSAMIAGFGRFQRCKRNAASVFGSPSRTASAASPFTSFMYQAQRMGDPVESVSGDLCPKTRVFMSVCSVGWRCRAPYRQARGGCHPPLEAVRRMVGPGRAAHARPGKFSRRPG